MPPGQVYPNIAYPLSGDVASDSSDAGVTVVGIQNVPVIAQRPTEGQILIFDATTTPPQYIPGDPIVSGTDAPGTPSTANPVQIAGTDNIFVREILTDPNGAISVSSQIGLGELLMLIIYELRATKAAIVSLDNTLIYEDYNIENFKD